MNREKMRMSELHSNAVAYNGTVQAMALIESANIQAVATVKAAQIRAEATKQASTMIFSTDIFSKRVVVRCPPRVLNTRVEMSGAFVADAIVGRRRAGTIIGVAPFEVRILCGSDVLSVSWDRVLFGNVEELPGQKKEIRCVSKSDLKATLEAL